MAQQRMLSLYELFQSEGAALTDESPYEEYHELRITGKRVRYLSDLLSKVVEKDKLPTIAKLKNLQTYLGELNDFDMQRLFLLKLFNQSLKKRDSERVLLLGYWLGDLEFAMLDRRHGFDELWRTTTLTSEEEKDKAKGKKASDNNDSDSESSASCEKSEPSSEADLS